MEKRDGNPYDLKTHEEAPSNYLSAEELINYFNSHDIPFERSDNLPRFCDNHKIKMIKEQREGSEGSVPTMYEKISSDKLETIKNSLKSINNSFLGREYLKKKKALILKIFDDAPLTKKYDEKLDTLPESGASNFTGEIKKKRKRIVKEKPWEVKNIRDFLSFAYGPDFITGVIRTHEQIYGPMMMPLDHV